ncbi:MAG TPA: isoleucine--tRNA ligase [Anaerolineales bacterium]|nr:isoleucine--tRNA ligase [Anaerolineales bacterium]
MESPIFKPVSPKLDVISMEESVLAFWQRESIFRKTVEQRRGRPEYVFYEGPPTANGRPGVHHVLARAFKDMFPRYKTMRGFHVSRRGGWDTHGLPVEIEVEKRHGFTGKQQIEEYGIARFNEECRKSAFEYIRDWGRLTDRIAFWVDLDDAYVTYTNDYIESVWWILKSFWDKDLLYKGYKVVPYCPRCGTPLSDHEVALGYEDISEPSVFVRMPLVDRPGTSLLVWTTTPWTLPGNVAVAVHPEVEYVRVERRHDDGVEQLILAKSLVGALFKDESVKILDTFKGRKLKGARYHPLFTFMPPEKPAHYVVLGDFVTTDDGSGLVHIAPAFGAEDMEMANQNDLPVLMTVMPDGTFVPEVTPWRGMSIKQTDPLIVDDLRARGLVFRVQEYAHTYPFCWRCHTPLMYYARDSWYIRTSRFRDRLVELNNTINWVPQHVREGRFGNWLSNNIDWSLSRERYWGTPLPVWECEQDKHRECIGSVAELMEKAGRDLPDLDLHRPYIDEVTYSCAQCGGTMRRVKDLIDVWFDSGAMPFAQWHYPFENQDHFGAQFPADYICEAVDQTRGWFYSLHAISVLLTESISYRNVICLGLVLDSAGKKMSKSLGNIVDPWDVIKVDGADAIRWYLYTATPPGNERRFSVDLVSEVVRTFTLTLWNIYSFFVTYANLDRPNLGMRTGDGRNVLDRWLLSELQLLIRDVTRSYEEYDVTGATRPVQAFVEKLSTWYLRRSRRRFWKSESDEDKRSAYSALHTALVTVSKLIAPAMPFLADELYQNLVRSVNHGAAESVHLADWPDYDPSLIDENLNRDMALVMKLVSLGHAARHKASRKVRQPLAEAAFSVGNPTERHAVEAFADLVQDELNVKHVRLLDVTTEAVSHSIKPLPKQLGQKYGNKLPLIQKALAEADSEQLSKVLLSGESISVFVDQVEYRIEPGDVEVKAQAAGGFAVAEEGGYVAALVTTLTPELEREGKAREFVRRVQDLRRTANLQVADRIRLFVGAAPNLREAIEAYRDYVSAETLALSIEFLEPPPDVPQATESLDGERLHLGLLPQS